MKSRVRELFVLGLPTLFGAAQQNLDPAGNEDPNDDNESSLPLSHTRRSVNILSDAEDSEAISTSTDEDDDDQDEGSFRVSCFCIIVYLCYLS